MSILVLAGLDPSGHAGLLADERQLRREDAIPYAVPTCLTRQAEQSPFGVEAIAPESLRRLIASGAPYSGVKVGALHRRVIVEEVARWLADFEGPVVLDPVLATTAGGELLAPGARAALLSELLPRVALVTPNLPEAEQLSGAEDAEEAARILLAQGARAVLVKGGHGRDKDRVTDLLVTDRGATEFANSRLAGPSPRGTGCCLSSALALRLAKGLELEDAVSSAIRELRLRWQEAQVDQRRWL